MKLVKHLLAIACATSIGLAAAAQDIGAPMNEVVRSGVSDCRAGTEVQMPLIAWGADGVTIHANGNGFAPGGALADAGWDLTLTVADDFKGQVEDYMRCRSPFLRGTLGMLTAAAPVTEGDSRTEQVVIYKHSWSAGDGIVAGPGIDRIADLAGKRIAIQAYGPHVDFVGRILSDGGLSFDDVEIVWTEDLTGTASTPGEVFAAGRADAAAVILPDARALTSGGAVGTGAEGSVQGATILFSTLEATAVIGDYIAVRKDYFDANRDAIAVLVNTLFQSEETVRRFMANDGDPQQTALATILADELLGGLPVEEGVFLWQDAITDGWSGNAKHFADPNEPRRFEVLSGEVNAALRGAGQLSRAYELSSAGWDYAALTQGLSDLSEREIAAFDAEAAAAAVQRLRRTGQLEANTRLDFQVFFEPDTNEFPVEFYAQDFEEILRLASTYSGAIITVEGHADPLHYLRREQEGATAQELKAIRTAAKNLSFNRSVAVLEALQDYAVDGQVRLNADQFTLDGVGIAQPVYDPPKTAEEWRQNMRVVFRVLTTQAEATTFAPLE
ncbi:MAG: ABC transporter substrate-binding protein [Pseudomonadota bacterium]